MGNNILMRTRKELLDCPVEPLNSFLPHATAGKLPMSGGEGRIFGNRPSNRTVAILE